MKILMKTLLAVAVVMASSVIAKASDNDVLFKAMEDEMRRNMEQISIDDLPRPYHMEYIVTKQHRIAAHAILGTVDDLDTSRTLSLSVRIRVGAPRFDNTNFFDVSLGFFGSSDDEEDFRSRLIPKNVTYDQLRRELWLATDACYKQAVEIYAKKAAVVRNRTRQDTTWDLSFMLAERTEDLSMSISEMDPESVVALVENVSSVFRSAPSIQASRAGMEIMTEETFYLNSEGRRTHKVETFSGIEVAAITQATDGMPLIQTYTAYGITPSHLPRIDSLKRAAQSMIGVLSAMQTAETIEPYSGPVLFEGQAAAQVIAQQFAPNLVAQRKQMSEGGFSTGGETLAFQNKIGARVLPEFLSMHDLPSMKSFEGTACAGQYTIDDEGVPAQDVHVVEKGYLKTLLSSRVPTRRVQNTNGHQRGGGAMFSVLQLTCDDKDRQKDGNAMRARLMELIEARDLEYGIIVREVLDNNILATVMYPLSQGDMPSMRDKNTIPILEAVKVYRDGHEEVLRGVVASGFNTFLFKDILAVGDRATVTNFLAPSVIPAFMTGGSQYAISTIITPDLLFEDVEVKQLEGDLPKPPRLANPMAN